MLERLIRMCNGVQKISISGCAINIANQAAIITSSEDVYFIEDMEKWEEAWLNKRVKVIGEVEEFKNYKIRFIKSALVKIDK